MSIWASRRSEEAQEYRKHYKRARWQTIRKAQLRKAPLCAYCEKQGRIKAAQVVDHIQEHKGDETLFWDTANLQSLCKQCHDSTKQREERRRGQVEFGIDGWPIP